MSKRKLFGTDGIRGRANIYPMTCEIAMALGRAVTHHFRSTGNRQRSPLIIIGKDTRLSCYMLEQAFSAGVCSQGGRVIFTGPLPTPGVAFATASMRANAGVMISASHNPYSDNGIKIFDSKGNKLPDQVELELEDMVFNPDKIPNLPSNELGRASRLDEVLGRYIVHVKQCFDQNYALEGMRLVVDAAHGAGYKVGPMIFEELGAEVFPLGVTPNGVNINLNCGSLYPQQAQEDTRRFKADLGICLDGDGDRVTLVDHTGEVVDGDCLIGILAKLYLDKGILKAGDEIVGTVMSNLGLENFLKEIGLKFYRAKVGDRYIIERMHTSGSILGGEPSGHIIFARDATTGDGALAALKAIECMKFYKTDLRSIIAQVKLYPQVLRNVEVSKKPVLEENAVIQKAIKASELSMNGKGRILLRYSGTESLLRVMVEGEDMKLISKVAEDLSSVVLKEIG
jgi:phosphoglucosamine mutase